MTDTDDDECLTCGRDDCEHALRTALAESQGREAALREALARVDAARDRFLGEGDAAASAQALADAESVLHALLADPSPAAADLLARAKRCDEAEARAERYATRAERNFALLVEGYEMERDEAIARAEKAEAEVVRVTANAERERDEAREKLGRVRRYTEHHQHCEALCSQPGACTCGLAAALGEP